MPRKAGAGGKKWLGWDSRGYLWMGESENRLERP